MKFTELEKFEIFSLTAIIMHMGELNFKQRPKEEQAECEETKGKICLFYKIIFMF